MGRLSARLRSIGGGIGWWCPGCDEVHAINTTSNGWQWDGNVEAPTISPSVLVTSGHYMQDGKGCWCEYNAKLVAEGKEPATFKCARCHTFIRDGQIEFLSDCSHALAGKTVPIPDWPYAEGAYHGA